MQANIGTLYNAKVKIAKHGTLAPTYNGLNKEYCSTNNVEYDFWFGLDDIKHCVNGSKKKYVLDWLVKIGTNLSRHEVLTLEFIGFQLQQRKVLYPRLKLSTIVTLPIAQMALCIPLNSDVHPTFRFGKAVGCNLVALMVDHKNKWESVGLWTIIMWLE